MLKSVGYANKPKVHMAELANNADDEGDEPRRPAPASEPSTEPTIGQSWPGGSTPPLDDLMTTHPVTGERGFFLFAYGSLCANPPLGHGERHNAEIIDYRRDFAIQDIFYRGTKAAPGLTLGLDPIPGETVPGTLYFAPAETAEQMLREVITQESPEGMEDINLREVVRTRMQGGHDVAAMAFVANPKSELYVGQSKNMDQKAAIIARAYGTPNNDYAKRHRPDGRIGKTDLEYLAMTALRLKEDGNGDKYLTKLTELAVQKREAMLASDDRAEVLRAHQLARFEIGTKVEEAFSHRIGIEVAAAAAARVGLPGIDGAEKKATTLPSGPDAKGAVLDAGNENEVESAAAALISDSGARLDGWKEKRQPGGGAGARRDSPLSPGATIQRAASPPKL